MRKAWALSLTAALTVSLPTGCGGLDYGNTTPVAGRTELVIVPTIHHQHRDEAFDYSFETLTRLVEASDPDVVVVQAPPHLLNHLEAPFFESLPGVRAAIEWARSAGVPVVGVSAFPARVLPVPPSDTTGATWARRTFARQHRLNHDDGVEWFASGEFQRLRAWLERSGADPSPVNWQLAQEAFQAVLYEHAGKRITLVFDANNTWRMSEAAADFAVEIDVRAFLR